MFIDALAARSRVWWHGASAVSQPIHSANYQSMKRSAVERDPIVVVLKLTTISQFEMRLQFVMQTHAKTD